MITFFHSKLSVLPGLEKKKHFYRQIDFRNTHAQYTQFPSSAYFLATIKTPAP